MREDTSSGIVVFRLNGTEREYLLLDRKEGFLDFPKGHIEKGESEQMAAKRETLEEAGLDVIPMEGFRRVMEYRFKFKGEIIEKKVIMFTGQVSPDASPQFSFEHVGLRWLKFGEAMELFKFNNQRELLEECEKFLSGKDQENS